MRHIRIKRPSLSRRSVLVAAGLVVLAAVACGVLVPRAAQTAVAGLEQSQSKVIVQTTPAAAADVKAAIARLGGQVTGDFAFINAVAATVPSSAVAGLADVAGVRHISPDSTMARAGNGTSKVDTQTLKSVYPQAVGADKLWATGNQGGSVTVAVVDSGWTDQDDFRAITSGKMRLSAGAIFDANDKKLVDNCGHGDHVAGIIGGNGRRSEGAYVGVAPAVNFVAVKVLDKYGQAAESAVINGLMWIYENQSLYNIKVVNLSLNSSVAQSAVDSPLDAACEILWLSGITVVCSAGNDPSAASGVLLPPANDPYVITVGATDDKGTVTTADDTVASYSVSGTTDGNIAKPDVLAPGTNIISVLSGGSADLAKLYPANKVLGSSYFKMSGTSMASAVVSGAVALLLQSNPNLSPDQVKSRLMTTGSVVGPATGPRLINVYAAAMSTSMATANATATMSSLLMIDTTTDDSGTTWNRSVKWNPVKWNPTMMSAPMQTSRVMWNSDYWGK
jgi:serine protease AprX